ncbi:MAG: hypothetical protein QXF14_00065 [Candidatus Woesearchaeota archaeon]
MKLFGLVESYAVLFVIPRYVPIRHPDLFKYLEANCKGASAGLELTVGRKTINVPPLRVIQQEIYLDLYKWFRQHRQKTYFLEPIEQLRKEAMLTRQFLELQERAEKETNKELADSLWREAEKYRVEAQYEHMVGKEQVILENIAKFKPDLVFLGAAHSSSFFRQRERLQKEYGITIDEYWEDEVIREPSQDELWNALSFSSERVPMERYLPEIEVRMKKIEDPKDALFDIETVCCERLRNAFRNKRVTDQKPDYIGSWEMDFEERGLFEVFVKQRKEENGAIGISGIIEDCNGSADFEGKLDKNSIMFIKKYTKAAPCAAKGEINYTGLLQPDGRYLGTFCALSCGMGNFWMKPFKEAAQSKSP